MTGRSRFRPTRDMSQQRDRSRSQSIHSVSSDRSETVGDESEVIHIRNLPTHWGFEKVRAFIKDKDRNLGAAIKFVKVLKDNNNRSIGESLVQFNNSTIARKALNILNGAGCEDRALVIEFSGTTIGSSSAPVDRDRRQQQQRPHQQHTQQRRWQPGPSDSPKRMNRPQDNHQPVYGAETTASDITETYGLNVGYLSALGIKLPLLNKIFIANLDLRVDEEKLKDIFGHAGHINNLFIMKREDSKGMAKIEYDHPVEAVQAISMLNNQELYGKKLVVHMDNSPGAFPKRMPEGLKSFGPGLGVKGEPMKAVRTVVELQLIKSMLLKELQKQKPAEMQNPMSQLQVDTMMGNPAMNIQNTRTPFNLMGNMFPLKQSNALLELQSLMNPTAQALQVQQSLLQPNNDLAATLATLQSQSLAQNVASVPVFTQNVIPAQSEWTAHSQGQNQVQSQNMYSGRQQNDYSDYNTSRSQYSSEYRKNSDNNHRNDGGDQEVENPATSDMVVFSNLPSSVTLLALSNKMREVGEVKLAETTGTGRAIVRFFNVSDAERCIKLFDRSKVDGQTIDVKFF